MVSEEPSAPQKHKGIFVCHLLNEIVSEELWLLRNVGGFLNVIYTIRCFLRNVQLLNHISAFKYGICSMR